MGAIAASPGLRHHLRGPAPSSDASAPGRSARASRATLQCIVALTCLWLAGGASAQPSAPELGEDERRALEAIGYLSESEVTREDVGVLRHDPSRTASGFNLIVSGHAPEAVLIDMSGHVVHRWRHAFQRAFPDAPPDKLRRRDRQHWRRAYLLAGGGLLAIFEGEALIRLDVDSQLVWGAMNGAHHSAHVTPQGEIYLLTRELWKVPRINPRSPVFEDFVAVVDLETGATKRRYSVLAAMENSRHREIVDQRGRASHRGDLFHTNSIELLDGRFAHLSPAFRRGNVLLSAREISAVFVMDLAAGSVVWSRTGSFRKQHEPRLLPSGRLLLFDNLGVKTHSRVLELPIEPGPETVTYEGSQGARFRSVCCGSASPLPNGNLLITETGAGRAIEVAPDREIVWEYVNPNRVGLRRKTANLFDVVRVSKEDVGWLDDRRPR